MFAPLLVVSSVDDSPHVGDVACALEYDGIIRPFDVIIDLDLGLELVRLRQLSPCQASESRFFQWLSHRYPYLGTYQTGMDIVTKNG